MKKYGDGPRWWNNDKRTNIAIVGALHTIIEKLDEMNDILKNNRYEGPSKIENNFTRSDGVDNVLTQVLSSSSNTDSIDFLDLTKKRIERNEQRTRKN